MPNQKTKTVTFLSLMVGLLVACAAAGTNGENPASDVQSASAPATWLTAELVDVRSGEPFTLGGFEGKVVIVETMAVWCPLCDQQQLQIHSALSQLGDDVVAVSLDVDPSETADIVRQHADDLGLDWYFALAGADVAAQLQAEFGPQILAPTATPIIIIAPDGTTELTPFGIKGWDFLVEATERVRTS